MAILFYIFKLNTKVEGARQQLVAADGADVGKLLSKIALLEKNLYEAVLRKERAVSLAQTTKRINSF
jgi:hypothetical protein